MRHAAARRTRPGARDDRPVPSVGPRGVPGGRVPGRRRLRQVGAARGDGRPGAGRRLPSAHRPPGRDRGGASVRRPRRAAGAGRDVGARPARAAGACARRRPAPDRPGRSAARRSARAQPRRRRGISPARGRSNRCSWRSTICSGATRRHCERSSSPSGSSAPSGSGSWRGFGRATERRFRFRARTDASTDVEVGPLDAAAFETVVRRGARLPRPVLRQLYVACDGNPLFGKEVAALLAERGLPEDPAAPIPVPTSASDAIGRRVAKLGLSTRDVLLGAAALPRPTVDVLVAAYEEQNVEGALVEAAAAGIVSSTASGSASHIHSSRRRCTRPPRRLGAVPRTRGSHECSIARRNGRRTSPSPPPGPAPPSRRARVGRRGREGARRARHRRPAPGAGGDDHAGTRHRRAEASRPGGRTLPARGRRHRARPQPARPPPPALETRRGAGGGPARAGAGGRNLLQPWLRLCLRRTRAGAAEPGARDSHPQLPERASHLRRRGRARRRARARRARDRRDARGRGDARGGSRRSRVRRLRRRQARWPGGARAGGGGRAEGGTRVAGLRGSADRHAGQRPAARRPVRPLAGACARGAARRRRARRRARAGVDPRVAGGHRD